MNKIWKTSIPTAEISKILVHNDLVFIFGMQNKTLIIDNNTGAILKTLNLHVSPLHLIQTYQAFFSSQEQMVPYLLSI